MGDTSKIGNDDSILESVKKMLGPGSDQTEFDSELLMNINGVFFELQQLGIGPEEGFSVYDDTEKWIDFTTDENVLNALKPYMYLKIKLIFDPPTSSSVLTSFENMINRFEWRLNVDSELKSLDREETS